MNAHRRVRFLERVASLAVVGAPATASACINEMKASSPYGRAAATLATLKESASSDPTAMLLVGLVLVSHYGSLQFIPATHRRILSLFAMAAVVAFAAAVLGVRVPGAHAVASVVLLLLVALAHAVAEYRAQAAVRAADAILSQPEQEHGTGSYRRSASG